MQSMEPAISVTPTKPSLKNNTTPYESPILEYIRQKTSSSPQSNNKSMDVSDKIASVSDVLQKVETRMKEFESFFVHRIMVDNEQLALSEKLRHRIETTEKEVKKLKETGSISSPSRTATPDNNVDTMHMLMSKPITPQPNTLTFSAHLNLLNTVTELRERLEVMEHAHKQHNEEKKTAVSFDSLKSKIQDLEMQLHSLRHHELEETDERLLRLEEAMEDSKVSNAKLQHNYEKMNELPERFSLAYKSMEKMVAASSHDYFSKHVEMNSKMDMVHSKIQEQVQGTTKAMQQRMDDVVSQLAKVKEHNDALVKENVHLHHLHQDSMSQLKQAREEFAKMVIELQQKVGFGTEFLQKSFTILAEKLSQDMTSKMSTVFAEQQALRTEIQNLKKQQPLLEHDVSIKQIAAQIDSIFNQASNKQQ